MKSKNHSDGRGSAMFDAKANGTGGTSPYFEGLEQRLLLTTLQAGDWFVYRGSLDQPILVTLSGSRGTVELMAWEPGDAYDPWSGNYEGDVVNIPGMLNGQDVYGGITGDQPLDTIVGDDPWLDLPNVLALAGNPSSGAVYAYDNTSGELYSVDPLTGTSGAGAPVTDSFGNGYDLTAMTIDPVTGVIYAVGDVTPAPPAPAPAGPYLITITPGGAATPIGGVLQLPDPTSNNVVTDMAFHDDTLYGTDGTNLFEIDPGTGGISGSTPITNAAGSSISGITGLESFDGTLYAAGGDSVYIVNPTNGRTVELNGDLSEQDITDLGTDGQFLYGVYSSGGESQLIIIDPNPPGNRDIFTIYVADAAIDTVLTFTEVGEVQQGQGSNQQTVPAIPQRVGNDEVDIHLYGGTGTAITSPGRITGNGVTGETNSPAGSGGVLIGGIPWPVPNNAGRYVAVSDVTGFYPGLDGQDPPQPLPVSALGVYPGGDIHPGLMSAGPVATVVPDDLGTSVGSLTVDDTGTFFAVNNMTNELVSIAYTPAVPGTPEIPGDPTTIPPTPPIPGTPAVPASPATITVIAPLIDDTEPAWVYQNVRAMDFDIANGVLVAVAGVFSTDPNTPAPTGLWLVTIDPATALVTALAKLDGEMASVQSLAIDETDGTIYAVGQWINPITLKQTDNALVTLNPTTGEVVLSGQINYGGAALDPIKGIDFWNGALYATTGSMLYTVSGTDATPEMETGVQELSALSAAPDGTDQFPYLWGIGHDEGYKLVQLDLNGAKVDFGRLLVAGTVAGLVDFSGSVEVIEVGHMWGSVSVSGDMNNMIIRTDFSRDDPDSGPNPNNEVRPTVALIQVAGTLRELDVYGNSYGSISAEGRMNTPAPDSPLHDLNSDPVRELEYKPDPDDDNPETWWTDDGLLMTVDNDTSPNAQFISNESGSIVVWGTLAGLDYNDTEDRWAISLMAGQTIRLNAVGFFVDPALAGLFPPGTDPGWVYDPSDTSALPFLQLLDRVILGIYNDDMNYLGSVGHETVEDVGPGSMGLTQEPLTFTAPAAGVYYLVVAGETEPIVDPVSGGDTDYNPLNYTLFIDDLTPAMLLNDPLAGPLHGANSATLGEVRIGGDLAPDYGGVGTRTGFDIEAGDGNLGAVQVAGDVPAASVLAYGTGSLVSFSANMVGDEGDLKSGYFASDNNIGKVRTTGDYLFATIFAGAGFDRVNTDAFVQNVFSAGNYDMLGMGVWASGGIGMIDITGDVLQHLATTPPTPAFMVDYDGLGSGTAYLDMIHVGGDWGALVDSFPPTLDHGANGDIRMISVEGDMYVSLGGSTAQLQPTIRTDGTASTIRDDGGGQLVINPGYQIDPATGLPITTIDPITGNDVPVHSSYSYWVIPVSGATGGVLARVEATGDVRLDVPAAGDELDVGRIVHSGSGSVTLSGAGTAHVYRIDGSGTTSVVNTTDGDLVCEGGRVARRLRGRRRR